MQTGRKEERRVYGGVSGGMRVKRRGNKGGRTVVGENRLSCSPVKGDLFVSVGLCYSPDVYNRPVKQVDMTAQSSCPQLIGTLKLHSTSISLGNSQNF